MQVTPYLTFEGRAEEAIEFYKKALGARVHMMVRFKDAPPQPGWTPEPAILDKVMHAELRFGDSQVMASDGYCAGEQQAFKGFSLTVHAKDDAEARSRFDALAEGGKVHQPLIRTFFASSFGVVLDRFGVSWMVMAAAQP